jgi:hypothetical protein
MKKSILLMATVLTIYFSQAQSSTDSAVFEPSTSVKWNYGSLYFGKVSLFGEYNYKHKKSVTLAVGIPVTHSTTVEIDDKDRDIEMKSFSAMAGYRMYLGKKTMTGVYFEPYLKYLNNEASTIIDEDLDNRTVNFLTTSNYSGAGIGAQLGVQFTIAKKLVFDFFFLGPEANIASHKVILKDMDSALPWTQVEAQDAEREIKETLSDIPIIGDKIDVVVDANTKTVTSDYRGFLPGLRFGLSVGYRF